MTPRSLVLTGVAALVLAGLIALALVVHKDAESSADRPPAPATAVTPLDALANALGTPGVDTPTGRLATRLSVERQVAQLFLVGFDGADATPPKNAPVLKREWGGVLVRPSNTLNPLQVRQLVFAVGTPSKRKRLPAIVTAAEPATGAGFPGVPVRKQPALGRAGPRIVRREATRTARRLRALGFRMALTPLADVAVEGGFREPRAFGVRAEFVATATRAAVQGYLAGRVAPAPGNFPGDGGVAQDPDTQPAPVGLSLPELRLRDLVPFKAVTPIAPAIQMTNAVYVAYDGVTPATMLPEAVGLLRRELRYGGAVLSADLGATSIAYPITPEQAAVEALKAGCDVLVLRGTASDQERAYKAVLAAVRKGTVSRLRLIDAVRHVLELKIAAGVIRPDGTAIRLPRPPKPQPLPPGTVLPDGTTVPAPPPGAPAPPPA
jgi:beta-N-acetylhexosaminidase